MENEKLQINLAPGMGHAEVILREGKAPELPPVLDPININIKGSLGAVSEYLAKRVNTGEFEQKECHILVDREYMTIDLVVNEKDPYKIGNISGKLEIHPKFDEFGINHQKVWSPAELGMYIKMNRACFEDRNTNMQLVSTLLNFTATVNNKIERAIQENGNRTDNFSQIVNSNLPASFMVHLPILKGYPPVSVEVETIAKIDGRNVVFVLISPGAAEVVELTKNDAIDKELEKIRNIAPEIAIIEV